MVALKKVERGITGNA